MKTLPFEHIMLQSAGYLITPMAEERLSAYMAIDADYDDETNLVWKFVKDGKGRID